MSQGLPVVASNVGGVSALVADGRTGLTVPPGDIGALADALTRVLMQPELRWAMARNAYQAAKAFAVEVQRERVQAMFAQAITAQSGQGR